MAFRQASDNWPIMNAVCPMIALNAGDVIARGIVSRSDTASESTIDQRSS